MPDRIIINRIVDSGNLQLGEGAVGGLFPTDGGFTLAGKQHGENTG